MSRSLVVNAGPLAADLVRVSAESLWDDASELARGLLEVANRTAATHVMVPFHERFLAAAVAVALGEATRSPDRSRGLIDVDPESLLNGRTPASAITATRFVTSGGADVAAFLPSPVGVIGHVAGDVTDPDQLAAASDIVSAFGRDLLDAGASLLVLKGCGATIEAEGFLPITNIGALFEVPWIRLDVDDPRVVQLPTSMLAAPGSLEERIEDADVVVIAEPVGPEIDLLLLSDVARRVRD